jgi:hypothetical protein
VLRDGVLAVPGEPAGVDPHLVVGDDRGIAALWMAIEKTHFLATIRTLTHVSFKRLAVLK